MEFKLKAEHVITIYDAIFFSSGYNKGFRNHLKESENAIITIDTLTENSIYFWITTDYENKRYSGNNLIVLAWLIAISEIGPYLINVSPNLQELLKSSCSKDEQKLHQWKDKTAVILFYSDKVIFIDVDDFKNVSLFEPYDEQEFFRVIRHNSKIITSNQQLKNIFNKEKETIMNIPVTNNFEFGPATESVRISPTGIAVTNDGEHWFTYDSRTTQTVDVTGFTFDFPGMLYKMPVAVKDLREGDVVLHKGKPMFVTGIDTNGIDAVDILESEAKVILPVTNMFNFSYVTKIVSFINLSSSPSPDQPFGNIMPIMAAQALFNSNGENGFPGGIEKLFMYNAMMGNGASPFGNLFNFGNNNE